MITPTTFVDYCRGWLDAAGLCYGRLGREAFVRAHPYLFGRAYEVSLRGYERWLVRHNALDNLDTFAAYLTVRFQRPAASVCQLEFPGHERAAGAVHVQQMVERGLIAEHDMRWTHNCRQPEHGRDAFTMPCDCLPESE
jgi:hypothetical protein